jgi:5-methylcytosine-specific restriction protein A
MRNKAIAAAEPPVGGMKTGTTTIFERSETIRQYVLARARGRCEACGETAPFVTSTGLPYLESHHIRRLTDGGPDDPRFMARICPNCHRRAHYSLDRQAFNEALLARIERLENIWV